MNSEFYGDRLRLARLLNGLTQQQLGTLVSASRQYIHQLESGSKYPADDLLLAASECLLVRREFFNIPLLNDVKLEQCHFRKRKTTPLGVANRIISYSTIFEELVLYIKEHVDFPSPNFPEIAISNGSYQNDYIESMAEKCRELWKIGKNNPISNITRVLENAGIIITKFKEVPEKIDALSVNRKVPIIIMNFSKVNPCRTRFDLAHECGHFVLHDGMETGDNITESEADRFASAFIFPRSAFLREFPDFKGGRINWDLIYKLKIRWGMSVKALIYKAHYFDKITSLQYRSANVQLNKSGYSKNEKDDDLVELEQPTLIQRSFDLLEKHLNIRPIDIACSLGIQPKLLSMITSIDIPSDQKEDKVISIYRRRLAK